MRIDNVADLVAETLQAGVKPIFGVVGDSLNGPTEALRRRKAIEWIHVRHEEVAALAAAGEAEPACPRWLGGVVLDAPSSSVINRGASIMTACPSHGIASSPDGSRSSRQSHRRTQPRGEYR